jgi:hypothetical protein
MDEQVSSELALEGHYLLPSLLAVPSERLLCLDRVGFGGGGEDPERPPPLEAKGAGAAGGGGCEGGGRSGRREAGARGEGRRGGGVDGHWKHGGVRVFSSADKWTKLERCLIFVPWLKRRKQTGPGRPVMGLACFKYCDTINTGKALL